MQRGEGGIGGSQSQSRPPYGGLSPPQVETPPQTAALTTHILLGTATDHQQQQQGQVVEEASPISSRPPATATSTTAAANLDEFTRLSTEAGGEEEDEVDRGGGGASGNRWPRQETLALLKIRSDMDAVFRDATLKGPLWEDVSRMLAEMGYRRSAKKCKEKFENVHKYYKRTREGRTGRQDGKSYRFFSQLEALNNNIGAAATTLGAITASNIDLSPPSPRHQPIISAPTTSTLDVYPVSVGVPVPMPSSVRVSSSHHQPQSPATTAVGMSSSSLFPPDFGAEMTLAAPGTLASVGISFSTDGFSSSSSTEDDDDDGVTGGRPLDPLSGTIRKRPRHSSPTGERRRMMEIFYGLMKQVMQKQEAMQQRFLEVIEKREQDNMMRDDANKRQEMARLSREHELMAQERAISASRDAAIVSFLQKITGQNIQLPSAVTTVPAPQLPLPQPPQPQEVKVAPLAHPQVPPVPQPRPPQTTSPQAQRQQQDKTRQQHPQEQQMRSQQAVGSVGSVEPASSRWPKVEVLALIKLRSGLESRYQEAGPKGQLWEEISAGMQRMGYKRSAKRCKEKWENINKYFKKVKESNKKRPQDAKTCPYFHELDALYKRKLFGGTPNTAGAGGTTNPIGFANPQSSLAEQQQPHQESTKFDPPTTSKLQDGGDASRPHDNNNKGNGEPAKKVKELIQEQEMQLPHNHQGQHLRMQYYEKMRNGDSGNVGPDEEDEYEEEGEYGNNDDEELLDRKMGYKIEFQRQKANTSNGRERGEPSFFAIVQ